MTKQYKISRVRHHVTIRHLDNQICLRCAHKCIVIVADDAIYQTLFFRFVLLYLCYCVQKCAWMVGNLFHVVSVERLDMTLWWPAWHVKRRDTGWTKVIKSFFSLIVVWSIATKRTKELYICQMRLIFNNIFCMKARYYLFITYLVQIKAFLYDQYDRK
jgi:hypothetical protein